MLNLFVKPNGLIGLTIVLAIVLTVAFAPFLAPYDPTQSSLFLLAPPDGQHWMGTDDLGRDTFSRLLAGSISMAFFVYVMVNGGMITGLLPVVGVPLPLISYGGTSAVSLLSGFGVLMSIHSHRRLLPR